MSRLRLAAGLVTAATLAVMEAADMAKANRQGDDVRDDGTVELFGATLAGAMAVTAVSLRRRPTMPLFWPGLAGIWAGIGINRWARRTLSDRYRPIITIVPDHDVVDTGPYAHVRHPMYLGGTLICLGIGTAAGTWPAALAWLLPPAALVRRIEIEERVLADALGDRYRDYAAGRARLVPGVW